MTKNTSFLTATTINSNRPYSILWFCMRNIMVMCHFFWQLAILCNKGNVWFVPLHPGLRDLALGPNLPTGLVHPAALLPTLNGTRNTLNIHQGQSKHLSPARIYSVSLSSQMWSSWQSAKCLFTFKPMERPLRKRGDTVSFCLFLCFFFLCCCLSGCGLRREVGSFPIHNGYVSGIVIFCLMQVKWWYC